MTNIEMGTAALTAAKARRREMQAKLATAADALDRALDVAKHYEQRADFAELAAADFEAQAAHALAALISADGSAKAPYTVGNSEAAPNVATARINASVAAKALAVMRQTHTDAIAALAAAEADVVAEARRILDDQAEELAAAVIEAMDQAIRLGHVLSKYIPDYIHSPVNVARRPVSSKVQEALDRLPKADELHTPRHLLGGRVSGGDAWARNLKALVADEVEEAATV